MKALRVNIVRALRANIVRALRATPLLIVLLSACYSHTEKEKGHSRLTRDLSRPVEANEANIPGRKVARLSPYDDLFRKYASRLGWDWRLLASISYQESEFKPQAISRSGAEGLMGIMPATARALGVSQDELNDPEVGIRTGVEVLRRFHRGFSDIKDENERIKLTLASYNAGIGHVYDAQRLAEKYKLNPNRWDGNVAECIRRKSEPEYYNDPVCKHGYLRGRETLDFVHEVMNRYAHYRRIAKPVSAAGMYRTPLRGTSPNK